MITRSCDVLNETFEIRRSEEKKLVLLKKPPV